MRSFAKASIAASSIILGGVELAFDAVSNPSTGTVTGDATWDHIVGTGGGIVLVMIAFDAGTTGQVDAVTVGGDAASLLTTAGVAGEFLYVYQKTGVTAGTKSIFVDVNTSNQRGIAAVSFVGALSLGTAVGASGSFTSTSVAVESMSGDIVVLFISRESTAALTAGTGETERHAVSFGSFEHLKIFTEDAVGSTTTMAPSGGHLNLWAAIGVAVKP